MEKGYVEPNGETVAGAFRECGTKFRGLGERFDKISLSVRLAYLFSDLINITMFL